jgi:hypothetical protein
MAGRARPSACGGWRIDTYMWVRLARIITTRNMYEFPIPGALAFWCGRDRIEEWRNEFVSAALIIFRSL